MGHWIWRPDSGTYKVLRGGGWYDDSFNTRVARRGYDYLTNSTYGFGFRCAAPPETIPQRPGAPSLQTQR